MFRISVYSFIYLLTLGVYILFRNTGNIESLVFVSFLISTLGYTFSREGLPDKQIQSYAEGFRYKASRVNIYGEGMIVIIAIASMILGLNSASHFLNQEQLILLLWPLIIAASYKLILTHKKRQLLCSIHDYILLKSNADIDINLIKWIIDNVKTESDLQTVPRAFMYYNTNLLRETYALIFSYITASNTKVSYEEIQAVKSENKKPASS